MEQSSQDPEQQPLRSSRKGISWLIVVVLVAVSFGAGHYTGKKGFVYEPKEFRVINQKDRAFDVDYNLLWDAIGIVSERYIDRENIDQKKVLYGAIRGAVAAAGDEYTQFFDPEELNQFKTELAGSFDGIGAEIGKKNGNVVIVAPLDGSPAEQAGLKAQDIIVAVDGQPTADWSVEQTVSKIRGPKGTEVTLTIYREGENQTQEIKIKRDKIELKSVKLEYKEQDGKKIAVITVTRFGDDTKELFDKAVNDVVAANVAGLILDLRNNPGGYLETSVELASQWLDKDKLVVSEAHSNGSSIPYNSKGYKRLASIKTITLINEGSASASEILAGALHDYKVSTLIGEKSFGKGSVQELIPLSNDGAVKVTVAKWITPNGKNLNKDGLDPDIEVKPSDEDLANEVDVQMNRALEEMVK